jgi:high-affinity iron transporter
VTAGTASPRRSKRARLAWWAAGLTILAGLVYLMATADIGPVDPTEMRGPQSHATVVFNASVIVFREGLEAILIFAAVTASMMGANKGNRRPVAGGAGVAFAATVATWFVVQAALAAAAPLGMRLEAITGFVAVAVLLVVMNWFVHKVYWSEWIGRHHRQRRRVLERGGAVTLGLVALGFTSVYREGFEVVLFLQSLQLEAGTATVMEGVAIGLAGTAAVGAITFWLHHKLPYRRMLVLTGVLLGVVLVVMIGGTAATSQDLGWLPKTDLPFAVPGWLGAWFEIYGTYETIAVQLTAAILVVGSYVLAEHLKVRRPQRRGEAVARRPEAPPAPAPAGEPVGVA